MVGWKDRPLVCGVSTRGLIAITAAVAIWSVVRGRSHRSANRLDLHPETHKRDAQQVRDQRATQYVVIVIAAIIVIMLLGLSLISFDISDESISRLLLTFALALVVAGAVVWWPEREVAGSRGNLGAALLGGAVVTFTVFGFQLSDARRQAEIDRRFQAILIDVQEAGNKIQTQGNHIQTQAIAVQKQATSIQRQVALNQTAASMRQTAVSMRQLEALQRSQPYQLVVALQRDLTGIDLQGMDLSGFYLRNKILAEANLNGANLSGANLQGADLRGANLSGANLKGAIASSSTRWPTGFDPRREGVTLR